MPGNRGAEGGRVIRPARAKLSSAGHQLLMAKCGPLDLLGEISQHRDYDALIPNTEGWHRTSRESNRFLIMWATRMRWRA